MIKELLESSANRTSNPRKAQFAFDVCAEMCGEANGSYVEAFVGRCAPEIRTFRRPRIHATLKGDVFAEEVWLAVGKFAAMLAEFGVEYSELTLADFHRRVAAIRAAEKEAHVQLWGTEAPEATADDVQDIYDNLQHYRWKLN